MISLNKSFSKSDECRLEKNEMEQIDIILIGMDLGFYWIDILYILCVLFLVVFDSRFWLSSELLNKINLIWNLELVELRLVLILKIKRKKNTKIQNSIIYCVRWLAALFGYMKK